MSDIQTILKGTFLASGTGMVDRPEWNYNDHFNAAEDKAAFEAKWANSSTPEEIQRERDMTAARNDRHNKARANEKYIDTDEVKRLRAKGMLDTVIAERMGVNQRTLARKCGNRADFVPDELEQAA